jgi:Family of unknown function (DUF6544)
LTGTPRGRARCAGSSSACCRSCAPPALTSPAARPAAPPPRRSGCHDAAATIRVQWQALDDHHLVARYGIDAVQIEARYRIDADGHLLSMDFDRWGDPWHTGSWGQYLFGGAITAYGTFDGLTIPSAGRFGWCYGPDRCSDGEFLRYEITGSSALCRRRSSGPRAPGRLALRARLRPDHSGGGGESDVVADR